MGDDDAVNIVLRQQNIDALCKRQHDVQRHVLGPDVGNLFAFHVGEFLDSRNSGEHRVNGHCARGVAGLSSGRGCPGDSATGSQNYDIGQLFVSGHRSQGTAVHE